MEFLLKFFSATMVIFLIVIQISLTSPYRNRLIDETMNGRVMRLNESAILKGAIQLDAMGNYIASKVLIILNGKPHKIVDTFPVRLELLEGDTVEIQLKDAHSSFYVYVSSQEGELETDLKSSSVLIEPGINRVFRVRGKR